MHIHDEWIRLAGSVVDGQHQPALQLQFSIRQWKFNILPHAGLMPALSVVSCFQFDWAGQSSEECWATDGSRLRPIRRGESAIE